MRAPLMEAEQDGSIRIQDLTEVIMSRSRRGLPEERLVPSQAVGNVAYADDRSRSLHCSPVVGLTQVRRRSPDYPPVGCNHRLKIESTAAYRAVSALARSISRA